MGDKRLEKAKYMTDVAKASLQMATNERDMAKIDGANEAMADASEQVERYSERIAMSEKTEDQDEELLGLAKKRVAIAEKHLPSTEGAKKALAHARAQDASLEKRQLMYQAEAMKLMEDKVTGSQLEDAKERVGKVTVELESANEVKAKAK